MAISLSDRIAALDIACRAEHDAVERAERAGNNCVAAAINRQQLEAANNRLSAAVAAAASN